MQNLFMNKTKALLCYLPLTLIIISTTISMKVLANDSEPDSAHSLICKTKSASFVVIPNIETSKLSEGIYGYSNLYYLPQVETKLPSTNMVLVVNDKELTTEQSMLDDVESTISVERYQSICNELIVIRARYFESGLESISEVGYIYTIQKNNQLQFIGEYDFVIGGAQEYQMLMNDRTLLPSDPKGSFSKLDFYLSGNNLQLRITNFLNTKSQTDSFSISGN